MKRYTTIGMLMGVAILAHTSTASAQRWGREATPRSGVCFYEDINFGGRYFCSPVGATTSNVPSGMNDKISSARVFGNAVVTVYRDPSLRGQAKVINYDISDMRGVGFNDRLSSFVVDTGRGAANGNYRNGNGNGSGNGNYGNGNGNGNGNYGNGNGNYGNGNGNARNRVQGTQWNYRDAETVVRRSYQNILGRSPDAEGLRSWTNQVVSNNWTQGDLENALRQSDEFHANRNNGNNNGNHNGVSRGNRRR